MNRVLAVANRLARLDGYDFTALVAAAQRDYILLALAELEKE